MTRAGEPPLRVAVRSQHALVRAGLAQLVHGSAGRAVVVDTATVHRTAGVVDVVVYDLAGLAQHSCGELERLAGSVPVVGLARDERPHLEEAARAVGVRHVVPEGVGAEALLRALEEAVGRAAGPPASRHGALTERELQVVALVAAGLSNHEIADHLFVTGNTIKTYVRQAYRKMGVTTRSQAVLWAVRHGVVSDSVGD